jgi:hypothetical protein
MIDSDPAKTAARENRRLERLGDGPHVCLICSETDPIVLTPTKAGWLLEMGVPVRLLEGHHLYARAHDPDTIVPLCRNCHAKVTEGLLRAGVNMKPTPDEVTRLAEMLKARATFSRQMADKDDEWASMVSAWRLKSD